MVRKKINPEEIDEDFLISTIQNEKRASEHKEIKAVHKQSPQINKSSSEYLSLFVRQSDNKARFGKNVPIRQEYHERIQKIVRVIGNDEVSIFNYIDNVLRQHFEDFQKEIVKLYNEKNKDIF
ncbi:DUF3408 domain-containing protein [Maribellus comscasis]|uniref:DUF3408 domain-containing protein n=1 Tax=Maribellus comscasis TaxID=2681766 RepID=A0A6I6K2L2_9BACT|nr:DUF3408 domain-containing protein [Maribellus comscasis]QGY45763.1 DUF3408 domain-containing protein [Maribellus comscasis]